MAVMQYIHTYRAIYWFYHKNCREKRKLRFDIFKFLSNNRDDRMIANGSSLNKV